MDNSQAGINNSAPNISLPPVSPQSDQGLDKSLISPKAVNSAQSAESHKNAVQQQILQKVSDSDPSQKQTITVKNDSEAPLIADDTDLIEKEWVEKAKALVNKTKNDPYTQNKEISKFKASYIKRRYNKDIQLTKD